ncbi:hypothetical protein [Cellulophaga sp. Asnod2-G02]|uniref:hypothetical protein n=2 Tax=unclassified Cellulophaga TaxID=2634405 RepID=UPI0038656F84
MKNLTFLLMLSISMVFFTSCDDDESALNYISFEEFDYETVVVDVNGSATQDVVVYFSNTSGSDRSFNIEVDASSTAAAGSYDVPSAVTVPGGSNKGVFTVTMSDVDLGIGVNSLLLNFENADGVFSGDSKEINYIQACTEVIATLEIAFDAYGSETGWDVIDSLGGVVVSGPGYADGQVSVTESISLCAGRDYILVFKDSYGDGMSGSYTLTIDGEVKVSGPGVDFATEESNDFDTN